MGDLYEHGFFCARVMQRSDFIACITPRNFMSVAPLNVVVGCVLFCMCWTELSATVCFCAYMSSVQGYLFDLIRALAQAFCAGTQPGIAIEASSIKRAPM